MANVANKVFFRPTGYSKPANIMEAVKLLAHYGKKGQFVAGGTDILVEKNPDIEVLIDITGLGLDYIKTTSNGIRIGAMTTFADIVTSAILANEPYNVLVQAAYQMGTPQIRNVATIGGNVCVAVPSADSVPALLVLDATFNIASPNGNRSIEVTDFFRDTRKTALNGSELLTEIQISVLPTRTGAIFLKKGRTATGDLALVNAAVRLTMTADNICQDVRIALGAVAATPLRIRKAEEMLRGEKPRDTLLKEVADCVSKEIKPINDMRSSAAYRRTLSQILVERALKKVVTKLSA